LHIIVLLILINIFLIKKNIVLKIPYFDKPLVSIIIPVHNNFRYTYNCIFSILEAEPIIPYEIIIGNDKSIDRTRVIEKYITNIIVHNNNDKYNFLMNCNEAAKLSKGKYILFLNNDTKVHKEWLITLIKLIESDENIGMVGSKLIYPNGILQEAGGIVWNNGECSNFGRGDNLDMPEYNYVKEVDYISGASILIRNSIWEKIGGFDKRYIPAYYEDTDLAFELRKHGYKVMYQPKSVVIHYEGISNGKDVSSGIKKYQLVNKKKFIEKWKNELKYQKEQGNTFLSRDRRYNKRILVINHIIPKFDKDAGSRCIFMYLKLFQEIGLQITFISESLEKIEPYTTILQQKGIEVLYGDWYKENLENWMKNNLKYFKFVYLQRPKTTQKYIDLIRHYFSEKIFYFAHDLHYIRLSREYNITHNEESKKQSEIFKKIEMEIFSKVDIIHVVGNYEYQILKEKFEQKTIRNIPIFIYENQLTNVEKDFSKRKDLIFVGGFLHSPNIDAVLWFSKQIYPKIVEKFPDIVWHIVGSNITIEIKNLQSKNIKIEGSLSDEELHSLYQNCRIAVVPLRFGAGVKGKIIEAAYNQIPIVTTSIGGEGLDNSLGTFIIEDDAEKMSEIISKLYINYSKLKEMSDLGKKFIETYFSITKAKEEILKDMV
jgi:GT2 family glycosyltransferase